MIQRPQTLFLLAVIAICIMLMFSNPIFFIAENIDTGEKIEVEFELKYKDALKNIDKLKKEYSELEKEVVGR